MESVYDNFDAVVGQGRCRVNGPSTGETGRNHQEPGGVLHENRQQKSARSRPQVYHVHHRQ